MALVSGAAAAAAAAVVRGFAFWRTRSSSAMTWYEKTDLARSIRNRFLQ